VVSILSFLCALASGKGCQLFLPPGWIPQFFFASFFLTSNGAEFGRLPGGWARCGRPTCTQPAPPCQVEVVDLTTDLMDALERVSGTRPFRVPGMAAGAPATPPGGRITNKRANPALSNSCLPRYFLDGVCGAFRI